MQKLGWCIRKIDVVGENSVQLSDGVSFMSPCFTGAKVGETWAVKYEEGFSLGAINRATLLESAGERSE